MDLKTLRIDWKDQWKISDKSCVVGLTRTVFDRIRVCESYWRTGRVTFGVIRISLGDVTRVKRRKKGSEDTGVQCDDRGIE